MMAHKTFVKIIILSFYFSNVGSQYDKFLLKGTNIVEILEKRAIYSSPFYQIFSFYFLTRYLAD